MGKLAVFRTELLENIYAIMWKRFEKSAWWIVFRKKNNQIEILLLLWKNSRWEEEYVIPKWKIEDEEKANETAIREICEETWLNDKALEIIKFVTKLNYTFTAGYLENNPIVMKDVYLFLVKYTGSEKPVVEKKERFLWYKWFTIEELEKIHIKFDLIDIIKRNMTYFF